MPSIGFEMRPKNSKSALRLHAGRPGSPPPELLARTIEFCGGTVNYTFVPPRGHEAAMPRNGPRAAPALRFLIYALGRRNCASTVMTQSSGWRVRSRPSAISSGAAVPAPAFPKVETNNFCVTDSELCLKRARSRVCAPLRLYRPRLA